LRPTKAGVKINNGKVLLAGGIGEISLIARNIEGSTSNITLHDVLYVPGLKANLFSITRTVIHGKSTIIYHNRTMHLKPCGLESNTVAVGYYNNNMELFMLDCTVNIPKIATTKCFVTQEVFKEQYILSEVESELEKDDLSVDLTDELCRTELQINYTDNNIMLSHEGVEGEDDKNLLTSENNNNINSMAASRTNILTEIKKTPQRVNIIKEATNTHSSNNKKKKKNRLDSVQKRNKCELIAILTSILPNNIAIRTKHVGVQKQVVYILVKPQKMFRKHLKSLNMRCTTILVNLN